MPTTNPQPDSTLVKALARAWRWQRMLDDGVYTSVSEIGDRKHLEELRQQDPAAGATGARHCGWDSRRRTDRALILESLERPLPASWEEQRQRVLSARIS